MTVLEQWVGEWGRQAWTHFGQLDPRLAAGIAILATLLLVALVRVAVRSRALRRRRRRQGFALSAESEAEAWLEARGFEIVGRQVRRGWWLEVDGEPVEVFSQVDLLVRRDNLLWVADVKTGAAADPARPGVRRQLREYLQVFEADGALVVDWNERRVRVVAFPSPPGTA